jgi:hypothetical protein
MSLPATATMTSPTRWLMPSIVFNWRSCASKGLSRPPAFTSRAENLVIEVAHVIQLHPQQRALVIGQPSPQSLDHLSGIERTWPSTSPSLRSEN